MAVCKNCGKTIEYEEKYCTECIDFLDATRKISYADLWKYKLSNGGCIGCRSINGGDRRCEECTRSHTVSPPFTDNYEKS